MLQGTLKDFGVADILQLVGMQRKTGELTLQRGREVVQLKFLDGNIVGADTPAHSLEDRLGQVLVRTGKITSEQLEHALDTQKRTLQRLGHILVKSRSISEQDLIEALRVQSMQTIFRLFRWSEGAYRVQLSDSVDYDERHFTPISAESVLMEGARMIDEWPMIERRIRSKQMIFELTDAARQIDESAPAPPAAEMDFDFVFGDDEPGPEREAAGDPSLALSTEERRLLALIDGKRNVGELNDLSAMGDFDTYRTLSELLTRDLIREIERVAARSDSRPARRRLARALSWVGGGVMLAVALASLATLHTNPVVPWRSAGVLEAQQELRGYASHARLERIEAALQVHYLDRGTFPETLGQLAQRGYVAEGMLDDPWGRPYGYLLESSGYHLAGLDARGEVRPGFTRLRRFTAAQRMILEGSDLGRGG